MPQRGLCRPGNRLSYCEAKIFGSETRRPRARGNLSILSPGIGDADPQAERKQAVMEFRKSVIWGGALWPPSAVLSAHQVSLPASLAARGAQVVDVHVGLSYSEGPA